MNKCFEKIPGFYCDGSVSKWCPVNFYCTGNQSAIACPSGTNSFTGAKSISDCWKYVPETYAPAADSANVGVVAGSLVGVIVIVVIVFYWLKKHYKGKKTLPGFLTGFFTNNNAKFNEQEDEVVVNNTELVPMKVPAFNQNQLYPSQICVQQYQIPAQNQLNSSQVLVQQYQAPQSQHVQVQQNYVPVAIKLQDVPASVDCSRHHYNQQSVANCPPPY